ncbi:LIC12611 family phage tail protein [Leptospira langatensis]|uniref:LIC12611 family phage tail protein n=1 Tax=Leptospira langatensis TaxID=2484983 RepID=UPI001AEF6D66|nr:hypothetical protein [Leptospira langatensis]
MDEEWIKEMQKLAAQFKKLQDSFGDSLTKAFKSSSALLNAWGKSAINWTKKIGSSLSAAFTASTKELSASLNQTFSKIGGLAKGAKAGATVSNWFEFAKVGQELDKQKSLLKNMVGKGGYAGLADAIQNAKLQSEGLATETDLTQSVREAIGYGHSLDFVKSSLSGVQKLAVLSGGTLPEVFKSAQSFIESGDTSLLKGNAALSKYLEEAKAIGDGNDEASQEKRRELLNKALTKNADLQNQYNEYLLSYSGAQEQLSKSLDNVATSFSKLFIPIVTPLIKGFASLASGLSGFLDMLTNTVEIVRVLQYGIIFLATRFFVWGAVIAGIILILVDLYAWLSGGESVIGNFLKYFDEFKPRIIKAVQSAIDWVRNAFNGLIDFAKAYGKYFIMALFPISILYYYFDQIKASVMDFVNTISDLLSNIKVPDFLLKLGSVFSNMIGGANKNGEGLIAGARASGGPVSAGNSYLVGEKGPELFTPGSSGRISPNGALGGSSVIVQSVVGTLTVNVTGSSEVGSEIKDAVMRALDELSEDILPAKLGLAIT